MLEVPTAVGHSVDRDAVERKLPAVFLSLYLAPDLVPNSEVQWVWEISL